MREQLLCEQTKGLSELARIGPVLSRSIAQLYTCHVLK